MTGILSWLNLNIESIRFYTYQVLCGFQQCVHPDQFPWLLNIVRERCINVISSKDTQHQQQKSLPSHDVSLLLRLLSSTANTLKFSETEILYPVFGPIIKCYLTSRTQILPFSVAFHWLFRNKQHEGKDLCEDMWQVSSCPQLPYDVARQSVHCIIIGAEYFIKKNPQ